MQVVFLESPNGIRLTKTISPNETKSYPNAKKVTSHHYKVPDLEDFEHLLRKHSKQGHCLLKGPLRRRLHNESRAGAGDRNSYAEYIVLDLDGVTIPGYNLSSTLTDADMTYLAEQFIRTMPAQFHNVSYIVQASSSLGLKGNRISIHLYMMLTMPLPVKSIKLWLKHMNHTVPLYQNQLELSATGQALKYPLDPSVADNSKLIFIAPPDFTEAGLDPFTDPEHRIVRVDRGQPSVDLTPVISEINPERVHQDGSAIKEKLRKLKGLGKRSAKTQTVTISDETVEVLLNPDKMTISVSDTSSAPYIRCNINSGDSNAYYFNVDNPTYMFNFKDEPIFEIEKADPDFYRYIFDKFKHTEAGKKEPLRPVVLRDFYTDTYYNGLFDPNQNQFSSDYPLTPTSRNSIDSFMRSHGRSEPDFIPDAKVVFDPTSEDTSVNFDKVPYFVNTYTRTPYMLKAVKPDVPLSYGNGVLLKNHCPLIHTLVYHMVGNGDAEYEHFLNWLAHIYQTKTKSMTAWILGGVPGTGKGVFVNRVLRPLFGSEHVTMKALENIEEQYNLYMRSALFLVVDEFRMSDSRGGTVRMADKLKNQITEPTVTIRAMRTNQVEQQSFTNFLFLTNRPDAIKIEAGDRRYNVAPRQEEKLEVVHPKLVANLDGLKKELKAFAGVLASYQVDKRMARTCMNNAAKVDMRSITMSVFDEFAHNLQVGDISIFEDVLNIELTNTFDANKITTAQRLIKTWISDAKKNIRSVIPPEHLRIVYHVLTEHSPQIPIRQFNKLLDRSGLKSKPQRGGSEGKIIRGLGVVWTTDEDTIDRLIDNYFEAGDRSLLRA